IRQLPYWLKKVGDEIDINNQALVNKHGFEKAIDSPEWNATDRYKEAKKQHQEYLSNNPTPKAKVEPQGKGEVVPKIEDAFIPEGKVAKSAKDVNGAMVDAGFEALPEEQLAHYNNITKEATKEKITELMGDKETSDRIATGESPAPQDLSGADKQVLFNAVKKRALEEGDVETLRKLATSSLNTERSTAAQTLGASGWDNAFMEDPVKVMQDVAKTRSDLIEKTTGKKPTPNQAAEVEKLSKQLEEAQKKLDAYEAETEARSKVSAVDDIIKAKPEVAKYGSKNKIVTTERYDQIKAELRKQLGSQLSSGLDPTIGVKLSEIGTYHFEAGVRSFAKWSEKVIQDVGVWVNPHLKTMWGEIQKTFSKSSIESVSGKIKKSLTEGKDLSDIGKSVQELAKHFVSMGVKDRETLITEVHNVIKDIVPGITRRETMDAISGYGKYKLLSKDEIAVQLRDLKGQMQQVSKLEDLESRQPPQKTGVERRTPSDTERQLIKQVEEAKKKYGIQVVDKDTQLKSSLDSIKTRLTNQIADLESQIASRQKIVKDKSGVTYDAEANKLKTKRDALKVEFDKIFGKTQVTKEQKIRTAMESVAKSIIEYTRKIKEKDISPMTKRTKLTSPELESLRKVREGLKEELQSLRDIANPKKTPEQIALQSLKTRMKNETQKLTDKLKNLDFSKKERKSIPRDAEAERIKAEYDSIKE
ncbi:MAG: hypothetical protein ABII22_04835, partial [Candidatus Micrarchaeota archaeon]